MNRGMTSRSLNVIAVGVTEAQKDEQLTAGRLAAAPFALRFFLSPVSITAGTTYVASYFAPNGHYSYTAAGFNSAVDNPPLHGVANGTSANGLYNYSATNSFPTNTLQRQQLLG